MAEKRTWKIVEIPEDRIASGAITPESEIKDLPVSTELRDRMKTLLTILGSVVNPYIGPAVGALAGNIGEESINAIAKGKKEIDYTRPILNALPEAGIQYGLGAGAKILGGPLARLKNALYMKAFSPSKSAEDIANILQYSDELKPTYGQVTGSELAEFMENALQPRAKKERLVFQKSAAEDLIARERAKLSGSIEPTAQRFIGTAGQDIATANLRKITGAENIAWKEVGAHAKANIETVTKITGYENVPTGMIDPRTGKEIVNRVTKTEDVPIEGWIDTRRATTFAQQLKPEFDKLFEESKFTQLPEYMQIKLARAKQIIDDLSEGTKILNPDGTEGLTFKKAYESIKQFRTDVDNMSRDRVFLQSAGISKRQEGLLKSVAGQLGKDIDDSVSLWSNGPNALKSIRNASSITKQKYEIFNERVQKAMEGDASEYLTEAFKNRNAAAEIMKATETTEGEIYKAGYFEHLLNSNYSPASKITNVAKVIDSLNDVDSPAREFFTGAERQHLTTFLNAIRNVEQKGTSAGKYALWIRGASMGLALGSGPVTAMFTGNLPTSAVIGATGLTAMWRASAFTKRVLMNPNYRTLANRLAKLPPTSDEAKAATKKILKLMYGTEMVLGMPGGVRISGYIDNNGKFKADFQAPNETQYKETHTPQGIKLTPHP